MTLNIKPPLSDAWAFGIKASAVPVAVKTDLSKALFPDEQADAVVAPALIARPRELTDLRLKLHGNGYQPVPIMGAHINRKGAGKAPSMTAWQEK